MSRPGFLRFASALCAASVLASSSPSARAQPNERAPSANENPKGKDKRDQKPKRRRDKDDAKPAAEPVTDAAPIADAPTPAKPAPAAPVQPAGGEPTELPKKVTEDDLAKAQRDNERPWAKGVTPEQQGKALALFNEGNSLLRESLFANAVEKYREALRAWDHPAIHYNLALGLVNLDSPLEMHAALVRAMSYGAMPLGEDKFTTANNLKRLVEKQLVVVEYTLPIPGAKLIFDGKEVLVGPGTWTSLVRAGEHLVVARADGYSPAQLNPKLTGGEPSRMTLKLFTDQELTREKRKMPTWIPYSVLGVGVVVAGVGGLLHASAADSFSQYDEEIALCAMTDPTGGCSVRTSEIVDLRSSGENQQTLAFTAYALGGVAIGTGIALFIINRPQSYRVDPYAEAVTIAPLLGSDVAGLAASGSF